MGDNGCHCLSGRMAPATENNKENDMESWSEKYYPGLAPWQHRLNNNWFHNMLELLSDAGILMVPTLGKAFNKQGEEIESETYVE